MIDVDAARIERALLGNAIPRWGTFAVVVTVLVALSVHFLLAGQAVSPLVFLPLALIVTAIAGWTSAGVVAGSTAILLAILWRFVFPPFVGYLRDSTAPRYAPPRLLGYDQPPLAELLEGLTNGTKYGLLLAFVVGPIVYGFGSLLRRLTARMASDRGLQSE